MSFRILALDPALFARFRSMDGAALARNRARRVVATCTPGFPCRVSLADAEPGEEVLLVHHVHQAADTPFHASHAIYVRPGARPWTATAGAVPTMFAHRLLSLRAFDGAGMLVAADVVRGSELRLSLPAMLAADAVADVHIHFAGPGCFAARAVRGGA